MNSFREWLKFREEGTTTASIAHVPMRLFGADMVRRIPQILGGEILKPIAKRKRKRKRKKSS